MGKTKDWAVEVLFATSTSYRRVTVFMTYADAKLAAAQYRSDAKGVRIVNVFGSTEEVAS